MIVIHQFVRLVYTGHVKNGMFVYVRRIGLVIYVINPHLAVGKGLLKQMDHVTVQQVLQELIVRKSHVR